MIRTLAVCLLFTGTAAVSLAEPKRAEAQLQACRDGEKISGKATLVEEVTGEGIKQVSVRVEIEGLPDGKHAIHIHEKGVCQPCGDAGGHFDPGPHSHSNPDGNHPFHMGDLINVEIGSGRGVMETTTSRVTLSPGPLSVFDADGSAFIIHDGADTYCPDGVVTGCAGGSRAACGIIKPIN
jgi:Cu-Zn family superoxide dismutase